MNKLKHYSLDKILKEKVEYNIIYGERGKGTQKEFVRRIMKKILWRK